MPVCEPELAAPLLPAAPHVPVAPPEEPGEPDPPAPPFGPPEPTVEPPPAGSPPEVPTVELPPVLPDVPLPDVDPFPLPGILFPTLPHWPAWPVSLVEPLPIFVLLEFPLFALPAEEEFPPVLGCVVAPLGCADPPVLDPTRSSALERFESAVPALCCVLLP